MMKTRSEVNLTVPRHSRRHDLVLGVDGGGTKTHAIIADQRQQVLGEGTAGPSNPLRVGVSNAVAAIREAVDQACIAADVQRADLAAAEVGLAGVRRTDIRERMRDALSDLSIGSLEVVTDADIALYGATDGEPGLVVIAGTGSICCGINARGKRACAGGWGPLVGDEGSGSWIARRCLQAVAKATDGRGPETSTTEAACAYFNIATPEDISTAIYAPNITNDLIAGFGRYVIEAAKSGDKVARDILAEGGHELGQAAAAVIQQLRLGHGPFQVAYVGGVFAAGDLVLKPLREEVQSVAPRAFLAPPLLPPAIAATRMARAHLQQLAMAV